jgi:hypothetical protein
LRIIVDIRGNRAIIRASFLVRERCSLRLGLAKTSLHDFTFRFDDTGWCYIYGCTLRIASEGILLKVLV